METFFSNWMWAGLGAAIVILIILFCTDFARKDRSISRWKDPMWLAWLGAVAYMLHNVEEYGIDIYGKHLSFVDLMTGLFGSNVSEWAYIGCNIPLVWIAGPLIAYICWKKDLKGMASGIALFELVNGLSHIVQGFRIGYTAGLVTSIVIFIPLAAWVTYTIYVKKHLPWSHFVLTLLIGVLYHVILIAGCRLAVANVLLGFPQCIYMTIDATLLVALLYLLNTREKYKFI